MACATWQVRELVFQSRQYSSAVFSCSAENPDTRSSSSGAGPAGKSLSRGFRGSIHVGTDGQGFSEQYREQERPPRVGQQVSVRISSRKLSQWQHLRDGVCTGSRRGLERLQADCTAAALRLYHPWGVRTSLGCMSGPAPGAALLLAEAASAPTIGAAAADTTASRRRGWRSSKASDAASA